MGDNSLCPKHRECTLRRPEKEIRSYDCYGAKHAACKSSRGVSTHTHTHATQVVHFVLCLFWMWKCVNNIFVWHLTSHMSDWGSNVYMFMFYIYIIMFIKYSWQLISASYTIVLLSQLSGLNRMSCHVNLVECRGVLQMFPISHRVCELFSTPETVLYCELLTLRKYNSLKLNVDAFFSTIIVISE